MTRFFVKIFRKNVPLIFTQLCGNFEEFIYGVNEELISKNLDILSGEEINTIEED